MGPKVFFPREATAGRHLIVTEVTTLAQYESAKFGQCCGITQLENELSGWCHTRPDRTGSGAASCRKHLGRPGRRRLRGTVKSGRWQRLTKWANKRKGDDACQMDSTTRPTGERTPAESGSGKSADCVRHAPLELPPSGKCWPRLADTGEHGVEAEINSRVSCARN